MRGGDWAAGWASFILWEQPEEPLQLWGRRPVGSLEFPSTIPFLHHVLRFGITSR